MQERHLDRNLYFDEQAITTKRYVIPYIQQEKQIKKELYVLEVGCGECGNLFPFDEMGCHLVGIDLNQNKIDLGRKRLSSNANVICKDIYEINFNDFPKFDIIFLRDVIEHIHNQDKFINFIKDDGIIFFAFPPWRMPFGGHQQICKNPILANLPFYHILPKFLYRAILKLGKESDDTIRELLEIKDTGISIYHFNRIVKNNNYKILRETDWFINPNYEIKFNLKPRKLILLNKIPFLRDFFTTCYYCIIQK